MMTREWADRIPRLGSQDGRPPEEVRVVVKYFAPWTSWTWYATEAEVARPAGAGVESVPLSDYDPARGDDLVFYGLVVGQERELGYWTMRDLMSIRGPGGLQVERDRYFSGGTLADVMAGRVS